MPAREMIAHLSGSPRHRPYIVHIEALPPRPPRYGTLLRPLPEAIEAYLARKGIRLYTHQCEAVDRLRRNEDIIITTSTASGKTLAFNLPVFERLFEDPAATALYLYPTKALANDQQKAIRELEAFTGIDAGTAVYDGDTPQHRRAAIRERARLVISNPYEMHQILPWHPKWGRFLSGLSYIVIDEAHRYRGVFGSHIAGMIRRLRRICGYYGSNPVFILSTATIANPAEFARRLTGREAAWVGDDGSPHGTKHFVLYNPFADRAEARPAHLETKDLFVACVRQGCRTLCFTASRRMAEVVALGAKDGLRAAGRADQVAAYRAGYLPQERRAIEDGLKEGPLAGVVSTNALELGIDIGSLDGVIISGYPGTMISVWQQAGRAGRQAAESFAILVAFSNPLDQYFMRHPQAFFARPHEHAVIDTENPCILSGHLLCAAAELPLDPGRDAAYFGSDLLAMADSLQAHHLIRKSTRGWVYAGRGRAVDAVRLDALSSETFRIVCNGRLLETMDRRQAYREAHPGALLLHQGETYAVADMDPDQRIIRVKPTDADYHTRPITQVDVTVEGEREQKEMGGGAISLGDVLVSERTVGYRILKGSESVGAEPLDLPPILFRTTALWFTVPEEAECLVRSKGLDLAGGLHAVEHAAIAVMPFYVLCDRRDIGGLSAPCHPWTGRPTIFVYDGYEGGIGLSGKAYDLLPAILCMTHDLVGGCPCEAGCPACIHSPKCGNNNQPLDKAAAFILLDALARACPHSDR